jgi:hypothetical protein
MIVVRNVFRLKFGKAKDVKAAMKEAKDMLDANSNNRIMFDLVGPSYTMVMEGTYKNLAEFESAISKDMGGQAWQDWYSHKFVPLVDSAYREIFTVLE